MSEEEVIGETQQLRESTQIEWRISDFFSADRMLNSDKFSFNGDIWHLILYPEGSLNLGFVGFAVRKTKVQLDSFKYQVSLKKTNGSVEHFNYGIIPDERLTSGIYNLIKRSDLLQRKSELMPSNCLTIRCLIQRDIPALTELTILDKPKFKELIKLHELSQNFKDLFADKESCDTTLRVKDKEFKVHKAVLIARSPVFAAMFRSEMSEKETGIINVSDCDPDSFQEFLEYLYCGKFEATSFPNVFHLYSTSDKYDIQDLKTFCAEYLVHCLAADNVCEIVITADKYDDELLFSAAQEFFNKNMNKIFGTPEWESLLKDNYRLANKLLKKMSSKFKNVD